MVRQLPTVKAKLGWIMGNGPPPQTIQTIVTLAVVSPATANVSCYTTAFVRKEGTDYSYIRLKIQEVIYHVCICIFIMNEGVWNEPPFRSRECTYSLSDVAMFCSPVCMRFWVQNYNRRWQTDVMAVFGSTVILLQKPRCGPAQFTHYITKFHIMFLIHALISKLSKRVHVDHS
jgi:hypothetical protein